MPPPLRAGGIPGCAWRQVRPALATRGDQRNAEVAGDRVQDRRMTEKVQMSAVLHHHDAARRDTRRRHQRVVGGEDRELARRSALGIVRCTEGHEPADAAPVAELHQMASDEPTEAVADDVYLRCARLDAYRLDHLSEARSETLVIDAWSIREAREVADAPAREEALQGREVRA